MTLCPIATLAGCKKCPAYKVCFAKGILGDYKKNNPMTNDEKNKRKTDNEP